MLQIRILPPLFFFFFFFEEQFTRYHSYKVSSLLSRHKGKLPTTVQCEKYGQIAVVAQWGPSFSTSVVWRSYKGGCHLDTKRKEEFAQVEKMELGGGRTASANETVSEQMSGGVRECLGAGTG